MKKIKLGSLIPIITMFIVFVLGGILNYKDLLIVGLVLIIPISFLVEGILCATKNKGFIIPLILSLSGFLIVIYTLLNNSANIYLIYYGVAYILGYIFGMIILKLKNK